MINEIWTYLISPVKAPPLRTQQFCAATWKSDRNKLFTKGRNTNEGLTTTSARNKTSEPYWKRGYYGHQRSSNKTYPLHLQKELQLHSMWLQSSSPPQLSHSATQSKSQNSQLIILWKLTNNSKQRSPMSSSSNGISHLPSLHEQDGGWEHNAYVSRTTRLVSFTTSRTRAKNKNSYSGVLSKRLLCKWLTFKYYLWLQNYGSYKIMFTKRDFIY